MTDKYIQCPLCKGLGRIAGFGYIETECSQCRGERKILVSSRSDAKDSMPEESAQPLLYKRRGRPPRIIQNEASSNERHA